MSNTGEIVPTEATDVQSTSNIENSKSYADQGINEKIVEKIRSLIEIGKLSSSDIDNRVCEQLRSFPDDTTSIDSLFNEFNNSDLTGVVNKAAFLCSFIKQWKSSNPQRFNSSVNDSQHEQNFGTNSRALKPGPDEAKLKEILERTGYKIEVTVGQRKYGGPPPDGPERPATRSEVFIGKLPREVFEDELIPLCEKAGKIWDLRLMIDPTSGFNKGYCFVTYCAPGDSSKASEHLNGYEIRPGKSIKANSSVANLRLFIGNIPKTKSKDEIHSELSNVVEGVTDVIIYTPIDEADKKKNRGFCFVDFDTHKNASVAKRKLSNSHVRVFNRDIAVDWADPDDQPDEDTMAQVKVLYVRNLTSDVSENDVKDFFLPYGNIERVRKVRDYAFIHFEKRDDAVNAMRALNGKTLGRNTVEVSLAKPLSDRRKQAQVKREQRKPFDFQNDYNERPSMNFGSAGRNNNSFNGNHSGAFNGNSFAEQTSQQGNNRSWRSNGNLSDDRGGSNMSNRNVSGNFRQSNRGGFNNDNKNYRGNFGGSQQTNYAGGFQRNNSNNPMRGGFGNRGGFGGFNGPQQNNNQSFGRSSNQMGGMNNNSFGANSMQQSQSYGGYLVVHHSPYPIGPVLAYYTTVPMVPACFDSTIQNDYHAFNQNSTNDKQMLIHGNESVYAEQ